MPDPTPFAAELDAALAAARAAASVIAEHAGGLGGRHGAASDAEAQTEAASGTALAAGEVRAKSAHDLVTFVDLEAQRRILAVLAERFPADAVLAEEDWATADGPDAARPGRAWIVDPLDGTTNFSHNVPPYAVSVALQVDGRTDVAVVLDVSAGETFAATRGGGAWVQGDGARRPLRVSETAELAASLVATGVPFRDYRYLGGYLAAFEAVARGTRGIRRHGSAAVDLAWVADGRFDAFFEAGLAPWDAAAGVLLVEEAGGVVAGLWDGADPVFTGGLTACAPGVDAALRQAVAPLGEAFASRDQSEGDGREPRARL